jgi:hypothetical protein
MRNEDRLRNEPNNPLVMSLLIHKGFREKWCGAIMRSGGGSVLRLANGGLAERAWLRLVGTINSLPAAGGEKGADTCADETKDGRKYGLSLVAGTVDGLPRTVIINSRAGSEASARSDSGANERVAPAMPRVA